MPGGDASLTGRGEETEVFDSFLHRTLSTRSDVHTYRDIVIRYNGLQVFTSLLGWDLTSPAGRISFSGHGADKVIWKALPRGSKLANL